LVSQVNETQRPALQEGGSTGAQAAAVGRFRWWPRPQFDCGFDRSARVRTNAWG